jgi:hypothetical protein
MASSGKSVQMLVLVLLLVVEFHEILIESRQNGRIKIQKGLQGSLVPEKGVEPLCPCEREILSLLCLPIPPLGP